ncbi:MAG: hypothetical protein IT428_04045 [Planctomycetaceae bacterium]|nr:hypothetical protein [Planctomycetaceae bacterium]
MAIQFGCPHCSAHLEVKDAAAGKKRNCPRCGGVLVVPTPVLPSPESVATAGPNQFPSPFSQPSNDTARAALDWAPVASAPSVSPAVTSAGSPFTFPDSGDLKPLPHSNPPVEPAENAHVMSNGVCSVCGCSESFLSKFDTGCRPPPDQVADLSAIPADIPAGEVWFEVRLDSGEIRRFKQVQQLCDLLIAGSANRFTQGRELYAKPSGTGDDQVAALEIWKTRTSWLPIGSGLLHNNYAVHELYDPIGANVKYGVQIACGVLFFVIFFAVFGMESSRGFGAGSFYRYVVESSTPGQTGKTYLILLVVYAVALGAMAAVGAGLSGVPLGFAAGYGVGIYRFSRIRRPPPDQFPGKSGVATYGWASLACVATLFVGLAFLMMRRS